MDKSFRVILAYLSQEESRAVESYQYGSFDAINHYLRTGEHLNPHYNNSGMGIKIDYLNSAIGKSKLDKPVVLYRGIKFSDKEPLTERLRELGIVSGYRIIGGDLGQLTGFRFRERGFSSASLQSSSVYSGYPLQLEIRLEPGQRGLHLNHESSYREEDEVLLSSNTEFEVMGASYSGKQIRVVVRVVD